MPRFSEAAAPGKNEDSVREFDRPEARLPGTPPPASEVAGADVRFSSSSDDTGNGWGRGWALVPLNAELEVLRADGAEVQIHRGGTWTAIQREGDRPFLAVDDIRGEDDLSDLFVLVIHRQRSDGNCVAKRFTVELHTLRNMFIRRQGSRLLGGFIFRLSRRCRRRGRGGGFFFLRYGEGVKYKQ